MATGRLNLRPRTQTQADLLVLGRKPVGTIRLNNQNQIAKRFMSDAGVYLFDGENIKNLCPCSDAGDLTKIGGELVARPQGRGLYTDNTGTASAVSLTTPDPGFWHDAKSTFTAFFHVTLEVDNIGPAVLIDIGGATNGFAVGYRTAPDTIVFATAVSSSNVEIASSTTYVPTTELRVIAKYDNGAMSLFVNGIKVASGSNGTSIPAHGNEPGVLGYSGDVSLTGTASRWGGSLYSAFLTYDALTDDECYELSADPYQILKPANDAPFLFPVATGGATINADFIPSATTFFNPTVSGGTANITADFISSNTTFYQPTLVSGQTLAADFIASTTTFFDPTVFGGVASIAADIIPSVTTFYQPTLVNGQAIAADFIGSTSTFYDPIVSGGAASLVADFITSNTFLYDPVVSGGSATIDSGFITASTTFFDPTLSGIAGISADFIAAVTSFFDPIVAGGIGNIDSDFISSITAVYNPSLAITGAQTITTPLIPSSTVFFNPSILVGGWQEVSAATNSWTEVDSITNTWTEN